MDYVDIVVKESPGLCRCCLSEGCYKDLATEYPWMDETEVYADMLFECFDISISQHPTGPNGSKRLICEVCITRLRDACNFKKQVQDSERKFVDMLARGDFENKERETLEFEEDMPMKSEMIVEEEPIEAEYLEDMDDFDEDDLPLSAAKIQQPTTSKAAEPVVKKGKRAATKKPTGVKPEKKPKLAMKKVPVSKQAKDNTPDKDVYMVKRRNLQIIFNNTSVIPFKWKLNYICYYCGDLQYSYEELVMHTRGHGPCPITHKSLSDSVKHLKEVKLDVTNLDCNICNETFVNLDKIIIHLLTVHRLPYDRNIEMTLIPLRLVDLTCIHCYERHDTFLRLIKHVYSKHPINSFTCTKCNSSYNTRQCLFTHKQKFHPVVYPCSVCSLAFTVVYNLQKHSVEAHGAICNVCRSTHASIKEKYEHIKNDHKWYGAMECALCCREFPSHFRLMRHSKHCNIEKGKIVPLEISRPDEKTPFKSTTIEEIDNDEITIFDVNFDVIEKPKLLRGTSELIVSKNRNIAVTDNLKVLVSMSTAMPFCFYYSRFACFLCQGRFKDSDELKKHYLLKHPQPDNDLSYKRVAKLNRAATTHGIKVDVLNLSCKLCDQQMPQYDTLVNHLITVHDAKYDTSFDMQVREFKLILNQYECLICKDDQVYPYFSALLQHHCSKHTIHKYICSICGEGKATQFFLKDHIERKHGKTLFECSICKKVFNAKSKLKYHIYRNHRTTYKCKKCGEKFSSQYYVNRHMINAHREGHKCPYCARQFTQNCLMMDHVRRDHLKEKKRNLSPVWCKIFREAQCEKSHVIPWK